MEDEKQLIILALRLLPPKYLLKGFVRFLLEHLEAQFYFKKRSRGQHEETKLRSASLLL